MSLAIENIYRNVVKGKHHNFLSTQLQKLFVQHTSLLKKFMNLN